MRSKVTVVKNGIEHCPINDKKAMTIYFDGAPTCRQIMLAVSALKSGYRVKPNLKSKALRFSLSKQGDLVRCQVAD
jgi:hypothetical protein